MLNNHKLLRAHIFKTVQSCTSDVPKGQNVFFQINPCIKVGACL